MTPLPPKSALIAFFESEPALRFQEEEEWEYNHLTFNLRKGNDLLVCEMEPAEMVLSLRWFDGDQEKLHLDIRNAWHLRLEKASEKESLYVRFSEATGELRIQKGTGIHVSVITQEEFPGMLEHILKSENISGTRSK